MLYSRVVLVNPIKRVKEGSQANQGGNYFTAIIFWSNTYFVTTMYFIEEASCVDIDIGVRVKGKVRGKVKVKVM